MRLQIHCLDQGPRSLLRNYRERVNIFTLSPHFLKTGVDHTIHYFINIVQTSIKIRVKNYVE